MGWIGLDWVWDLCVGLLYELCDANKKKRGYNHQQRRKSCWKYFRCLSNSFQRQDLTFLKFALPRQMIFILEKASTVALFLRSLVCDSAFMVEVLTIVVNTFKILTAERVQPVPIYCRYIFKRYIHSQFRYIGDILAIYCRYIYILISDVAPHKWYKALHYFLATKSRTI